MKQIYYTQCPIGYGLGASNGFQIKRLSPGYPISGDFRHLGFRAFVPGTRTMAPPAMRYRRGDQGAAELAWLNPRSHEYETERGLWGRPGGHFAHGLLLDEAELERLANWPAGLYDRPFWTRSDPGPSRGEPPRPLDLTAGDLGIVPTFDAFDSLAKEEDPERLAHLLTALAAVVREGRTLFLIDEPDRLAARIALLTLAFPASWRPDLTFSTYHDRPEELPGFRVQGTSAAVRPNRAALLSQGIVADVASGTCEPRLEPAPWARTLATWVVRRGDNDRRAWEESDRRARRIHERGEAEPVWTDDFLDRFYGFEDLVQAPAAPPSDAAGWTRLTEVAHWAERHGLAEELVPARPPAWWVPDRVTGPEARGALVSHLSLPAAWRTEGAPAAWGEAVAQGLRTADRAERLGVIDHALTSAPAAARPAFVRALIGALPTAETQEALLWLEAHPACDRALLLPLGVHAAVDNALNQHEPQRIHELLGQAFDLPGALPAVLDALAAAAASRPSAFEDLAAWLAGSLESAGRKGVAEVLRWGLRQRDDAIRWLGTYLRRVFADPTGQETWRSIDRLVPAARKPRFAQVILTVASDPNLSDEAFRWSVEEVLLVLPEAARPHDPSWPGEYLDRTPSGLDLLKRLFAREYRPLGILRWLEQARSRGELSEGAWERIEDCERYARALRAGDARSLIDTKLPTVPPEDRGAMLAQILRHVSGGTSDSLNLALDTCREAWPGAFRAGQAGLAGLARALTDPLIALRSEPAQWFERLVEVLNRLGLRDPIGDGFEPDSLAAEVLAETTRRPGPDGPPWRLRQFVLQNETAWRILAADVRRDVEGTSLAAVRDGLEQWDRHLEKGMHTARFFEVWLNVCQGPALATAVASRAADLRSLPPLSWWDRDRFPESRDDLRDAFARLVPMAPLPEESLPAVQGWLRPPRRAASGGETDAGGPLPATGPTSPESSSGESSPVSRAGLARWRCLEALTAIYRTGVGSEACWQGLAAWTRGLPLAELEVSDRYQFLAWFLRRVEAAESYQVARLAKWLLACGLTDADRVSRWAEELDSVAPVPDSIRVARLALVGELRSELKNVIRDARDQPRKSPGPDSP